MRVAAQRKGVAAAKIGVKHGASRQRSGKTSSIGNAARNCCVSGAAAWRPALPKAVSWPPHQHNISVC